MEIDLVSVQWVSEDGLPQGISNIKYDLIYTKSKVIGGVRMFPFIEIYDNNGQPEHYYLSS